MVSGTGTAPTTPVSYTHLLRFPKTPALSGIYATWVHGVGDRPHASVSSFGTRPTVDGVEPLLEAHLFDFDGDLYAVSYTHLDVYKRQVLQRPLA